MAFSIKLKGTPKLARLLRRDMDRLQREMQRAGNDIEREIVARTLSGQDVNDKPFKPYTEGYKTYKEKLGLYAGHPDIHLTGETLGGITSRVTREGDTKVSLEVKIEGEAALQKAEWTSKKRKWFGLSKGQKKRVRETINRIFGRK